MNSTAGLLTCDLALVLPAIMSLSLQQQEANTVPTTRSLHCNPADKPSSGANEAAG